MLTTPAGAALVQSKIFRPTTLVTCTFVVFNRTAFTRPYCATTSTDAANVSGNSTRRPTCSRPSLYGRDGGDSGTNEALGEAYCLECGDLLSEMRVAYDKTTCVTCEPS